MNDIFGNLERSGYEEIASYGPPFLTELKEMDAVFRFAGRLTDMIAESMEKIVDNQFILMMDSDSLTVVENFLGIQTDLTISLDHRKKNVLALLHASRKFSKTTISEIIRSYASAQCDVNLTHGTLNIHVEFLSNPVNYMKEIVKIIMDKMPCHLRLDMTADIVSDQLAMNYIAVASNTVRITEIGGIEIE